MYKCQECGRKFKTTEAAQRAVNDGCPGCGGSDIDLYTTSEKLKDVVDATIDCNQSKQVAAIKHLIRNSVDDQSNFGVM